MTAAAPRTTTHFDVDQLTVDDSESLLSLHAFLREQSQMDEEMSAGMHCPDVDGDKQGPVDGTPRDAMALTTLPTGETAALASSTNSTIHPKPSIYSLHSFLRQPGPLELADMPVELLVKILDMVVAVRSWSVGTHQLRCTIRDVCRLWARLYHPANITELRLDGQWTALSQIPIVHQRRFKRPFLMDFASFPLLHRLCVGTPISVEWLARLPCTLRQLSLASLPEVDVSASASTLGPPVDLSNLTELLQLTIRETPDLTAQTLVTILRHCPRLRRLAIGDAPLYREDVCNVLRTVNTALDTVEVEYSKHSIMYRADPLPFPVDCFPKLERLSLVKRWYPWKMKSVCFRGELPSMLRQLQTDLNLTHNTLSTLPRSLHSLHLHAFDEELSDDVLHRWSITLPRITDLTLMGIPHFSSAALASWFTRCDALRRLELTFVRRPLRLHVLPRNVVDLALFGTAVCDFGGGQDSTSGMTMLAALETLHIRTAFDQHQLVQHGIPPMCGADNACMFFRRTTLPRLRMLYLEVPQLTTALCEQLHSCTTSFFDTTLTSLIIHETQYQQHKENISLLLSQGCRALCSLTFVVGPQFRIVDSVWTGVLALARAYGVLRQLVIQCRSSPLRLPVVHYREHVDALMPLGVHVEFRVATSDDEDGDGNVLHG